MPPLWIQGKWKPISEYVDPPYRGSTPIVLLGWHSFAGGGYPAGVWHYGVGWKESFGGGRWVDASDKKPWPNGPTHFALICNQIEQPDPEDQRLMDELGDACEARAAARAALSEEEKGNE